MKIRYITVSSLAVLLLASGCDDDEGRTTPTPDGGGAADAAVSTDARPGDGAAPEAAVAGDGGGSDAAGTQIAMSSGPFVEYPNPAGDGTPNPAMGIMGSATAFDLGGGKTKVVLTVSGLPAMRTFGAHVHKLACDMDKAGGHYQHIGFPPDGGSATDPMYANSTNEVWLDFTTDMMGKATKETTVSFRPRAGEAKAIVVHAMMTAIGADGGGGGVAGPKLACIPIAF